MEPIGFFVQLATGILAYAWFMLYGSEMTYGNIHQSYYGATKVCIVRFGACCVWAWYLTIDQYTVSYFGDWWIIVFISVYTSDSFWSSWSTKWLRTRAQIHCCRHRILVLQSQFYCKRRSHLVVYSHRIRCAFQVLLMRIYQVVKMDSEGLWCYQVGRQESHSVFVFCGVHDKQSSSWDSWMRRSWMSVCKHRTCKLLNSVPVVCSG